MPGTTPTLTGSRTVRVDRAAWERSAGVGCTDLIETAEARPQWDLS